MAYTISRPELVTEALIQINSPSLSRTLDSPGVIMETAVPVVASGTVDFGLDIFASVDFGQAVRFRLHCPRGDTDWYTVGTPDVYDPKSAAAAATPQLLGALPEYYRTDDGPFGFAIYPNRASLTQRDRFTGKNECTVEAQVGGTLVNVINPRAGSARIMVWLDVRRPPVAARYLELKLILKGPDGGSEEIKRIPFSE